MSVFIITNEDIINMNISLSNCYKYVEDMIKNKQNNLLPPKISLKPEEGKFFNIMPAILNSENCHRGGGKTGYPYTPKSSCIR